MQYLQKLTATGIALFICSMAIMAQTGNEWDDPTITSVNRETAHTWQYPWPQKTRWAATTFRLPPSTNRLTDSGSSIG